MHGGRSTGSQESPDLSWWNATIGPGRFRCGERSMGTNALGVLQSHKAQPETEVSMQVRGF